MSRNAEERWPVRMGETWWVGPHRFICADVETFDWASIPTPQLIYTDPPWDKGHARMFRHKAGIGEGAGWPAPIIRLAEAMRYYDCPAYIQWSARSVEECQRLIEAHSEHRLLKTWPLTYEGGPMVLLCFSRRTDIRVPQWVEDGAAIGCVLGAATKPGDVVLDPFAGKGTTLRVAHRYSCVGIGIEIIQRKIALGLLSLAYITGLDPRGEGEE